MPPSGLMGLHVHTNTPSPAPFYSQHHSHPHSLNVTTPPAVVQDQPSGFVSQNSHWAGGLGGGLGSSVPPHNVGAGVSGMGMEVEIGQGEGGGDDGVGTDVTDVMDFFA